METALEKLTFTGWYAKFKAGHMNTDDDDDAQNR